MAQRRGTVFFSECVTSTTRVGPTFFATSGERSFWPTAAPVRAQRAAQADAILNLCLLRTDCCAERNRKIHGVRYAKSSILDKDVSRETCNIPGYKFNRTTIQAEQRGSEPCRPAERLLLKKLALDTSDRCRSRLPSASLRSFSLRKLCTRTLSASGNRPRSRSH